MRTTRVLIVHTGASSHFPGRDREALSARYTAETCGFSGFRDLPHLRRKMKSVDVVLFWFVGRAAILAMLPPPQRPKIIALVGGYEPARVREFGYGSSRSPWMRGLVRHVCRRSDLVIAVSEFTRNQLKENLGIAGERVVVLHNAVNTDFFTPAPEPRELNLVLTVAYLDRQLILRKGLDVLAQVAHRMPETHFAVAGRLSDDAAIRFAEEAPPNLEFVGELSQESLRTHYRRASVCFQPSRYESFGVSVIEAMACGCVPVISTFGALPEVVGNAGYMLNSLDPDHAAVVLRQALCAPPAARDRARARVCDNFDSRRRAERLYQLIERVLA